MTTPEIQEKEIIYRKRIVKFLRKIFNDVEGKILKGENIDSSLDCCNGDVVMAKNFRKVSNPKVSDIRMKLKTNKHHKPRLSVLESGH